MLPTSYRAGSVPNSKSSKPQPCCCAVAQPRCVHRSAERAFGSHFSNLRNNLYPWDSFPLVTPERTYLTSVHERSVDSSDLLHTVCHMGHKSSPCVSFLKPTASFRVRPRQHSSCRPCSQPFFSRGNLAEAGNRICRTATHSVERCGEGIVRQCLWMFAGYSEIGQEHNWPPMHLRIEDEVYSRDGYGYSTKNSGIKSISRANTSGMEWHTSRK